MYADLDHGGGGGGHGYQLSTLITYITVMFIVIIFGHRLKIKVNYKKKIIYLSFFHMLPVNQNPAFYHQA